MFENLKPTAKANHDFLLLSHFSLSLTVFVPPTKPNSKSLFTMTRSATPEEKPTNLEDRSVSRGTLIDAVIPKPTKPPPNSCTIKGNPVQQGQKEKITC